MKSHSFDSSTVSFCGPRFHLMLVKFTLFVPSSSYLAKAERNWIDNVMMAWVAELLMNIRLHVNPARRWRH